MHASQIVNRQGRSQHTRFVCRTGAMLKAHTSNFRQAEKFQYISGAFQAFRKLCGLVKIVLTKSVAAAPLGRLGVASHLFQHSNLGPLPISGQGPPWQLSLAHPGLKPKP